jgi:transposase InsO family protein
MRFAFIHAEGAKLPTSLLCRTLKVSRSGFYAWSKRPPSRHAFEDSKLVPVIRASHAQSRATYGSPRVHKDLQALSYRVSCKRVARLMRREGLSARPPRRYRATTDSKHALPIAPNVVAREFHATAPRRRRTACG